MHRQFCTPHLLAGGKTTMLQRVGFGEKSFDESRFQQILWNSPTLLPVDDIEPLFAPLVPLAREMPTKAGLVDLVYINGEGYLTLVETKLWRNPEARRQVVAQIIDYAIAISKWSYEDLQQAVQTAGNDRNDPVADVVASETTFGQARFVDTVSRNLARGRFLLLVVGDGIQEGVEHLASTLANSPHLGFSLALVEMAIFRAGNSENDLFFQPRTIARTREVVRAVVELKAGISPADIRVTVPTPERIAAASKRQTITEEALLEELAKTTSKSEADAFRSFLDDVQELGIDPECRDSSISLRWHEPISGRRFSFGSVHAKGGKLDLRHVRYFYIQARLNSLIGKEYIQTLASCIPGAHEQEQIDSLRRPVSKALIGGREISIADILPHKQTWLAAIQEAMRKTELAVTSNDTPRPPAPTRAPIN